MADQLVNTFKKKLLESYLSGQTVKLMLLDDNHSTDIDTQEFIDDVSTNEVSGSGYTSGGETLGSMTFDADNTDDEGVFDAANVTWNSASFTARYGALYRDSGTPSTSPIIGVLDFTENKTASNGDFTVSFNSEGIVTIT